MEGKFILLFYGHIQIFPPWNHGTLGTLRKAHAVALSALGSAWRRVPGLRAGGAPGVKKVGLRLQNLEPYIYIYIVYIYIVYIYIVYIYSIYR